MLCAVLAAVPAAGQTHLLEILRRVATMADPVDRAQDQLRRLSRAPLTVKGLAARAARIVREERGALEILVFDGRGKLVQASGTAPVPVAVTERFLEAVATLRPESAAGIAGSFAGHPSAVPIMSYSEGELVNLWNGPKKTFGGFWRVRDPRDGGARGGVRAFLIAFLHRGKVDPDALLDRAVGEANRLLAGKCLVGWVQPGQAHRPGSRRGGGALRPGDGGVSRAGTLRPPLERLILAAALDHRSSRVLSFRGETVAFEVTGRGDLIYCREALPAQPGGPVSGAAHPWRVAGGFLLTLGAIWLAGRWEGGLRSRIFLILLCSAGLPILALLATAEWERRDRETCQRAEAEQAHLAEMAKMDEGFASRLRSLTRRFGGVLTTRDFRAPVASAAILARLQRACPTTSRSFLWAGVADAKGDLVAAVGNAWQWGNMRFRVLAPGLLRGFLDVARDRPEGDPGGQVPANPILALGGKSIYWSWSKGLRQSMVDLGGQRFLACFDFALDATGHPAGGYLALFEVRFLQMQFVESLARRWKRGGRQEVGFAALPLHDGTALVARSAGLPPVDRSVGGRFDWTEHPVLRQLRNRVKVTDLPQHLVEWIGGEEYLISAGKGAGLGDYALLLLQPRRALETRQPGIRGRAFLLAGLLLAGGLLAAIRVSGHILAGMAGIQHGLESLRDRRFHQATVPAGPQELAALGERLNGILGHFDDLQVAQEVQDQMRPEGPLQGKGWSVAGFTALATDLGGDFQDWFTLDDGRVVLAVGDVAGHGIPSALVAASAKMELMIQATRGALPGAILEEMNRAMLEQTGRFRPMSIWLGIFDPATSLLHYASAGHPFPLVLRGREEPLAVGLPAYPLGATKKGGFREACLDLSAGGTVVIYTDGLIEARGVGGAVYGYERFSALVRAAGQDAPDGFPKDPPGARPGEGCVRRIRQAIEEWTGTTVPEDDQTLTVLRVEGGTPS